MMYLVNILSCFSTIIVANMGPHMETLLHAASFGETLSISTHLTFPSITFGWHF